MPPGKDEGKRVLPMCALLEELDLSPLARPKKLVVVAAMKRAGGAADGTTLCQFDAGPKCPYYEPPADPTTSIRRSTVPESG